MIFIGSDHAGFELKKFLIENLSTFSLKDCGTFSLDSVDYPLISEAVAHEVLSQKESLGILICGTGIGVSIAANKVCGIRAALISDEFSAEMAKAHNDANIICLGSRVLSSDKALQLVKIFLNSKFDTSNPRHARRIAQFKELEERKRSR